MFRKQDFKKIDLLGSGKKNTKIYKAEHIPTGKFYAIKEVEAKTLDKLNEYKEEAVQLFKVQNHPNVLQFYGYYFYETMYNTFRIDMVCEYMDHRTNLEYLFRKRKQQNLFWKQDELEKMIVSVISTLSYLQSVGICHRDIKPANMFLSSSSGEIKLIDFGESKDYYKDQDDGGMGTMATIRGTPQYLSPILWRSHVEEGGNTRHATHNIFKSDVFSCGLIFFQLASMDDVTGFNQKNQVNDGEKLIDHGLKKLKQRYSDHIIEILRLMLKFEEADRPSFIELAKLVLTSTENTIDSPKGGKKPIGSSGSAAAIQKSIEESNQNKKVNKTFSNQNFKENSQININGESHNASNCGHNFNNKRDSKSGGMVSQTQQLIEESQQNLMTQSELFKNYSEQNRLYLNLTNQMFWFEFGGNKIGRLFIEGPEAEEYPKWRLIAKYKGEFPCHFTLVYINGGAVGPDVITQQQNKNVGTWFLLGGMGNNCLQYIDKNIVNKCQMLQEKSFFSAVAVKGSHIHTFGGYDNVEKCQLKSCEVYSIDKDRWHGNDEVQLNEARSQSSAALFDDNTIFIFGGYNKEIGTLSSIERYDICKKRITKVELAMPVPLRRFASVKISATKILLLGGVSRLSKDSDAVFCFDVDQSQEGNSGKNQSANQAKYSIENLDKVDKAGVIDYPVILDSVGSLHLFIENASGTSPPQRAVYSFLEYS